MNFCIIILVIIFIRTNTRFHVFITTNVIRNEIRNSFEWIYTISILGNN